MLGLDQSETGIDPGSPANNDDEDDDDDYKKPTAEQSCFTIVIKESSYFSSNVYL